MLLPYPKSLQRFLNACIAEGHVILSNDVATQNIAKSIAQTIASDEDVLPTNRDASPRDDFFRRIFFQFTELFNSYQLLADFQALGQSRPPRHLKFSNARLVTFWREAYLNEYYIYLQRMDAFLVKVERWYRKDTRLPRFSADIEQIRSSIQELFRTLQEIRGSHVHEHRYQEQDPELKRVHLLELLVVHGKQSLLRPVYLKAVQKAKSSNTKYFRLLTKEAKKGLKLVFDCLSATIVDVEGRLIFPMTLRVRSRSSATTI